MKSKLFCIILSMFILAGWSTKQDLDFGSELTQLPDREFYSTWIWNTKKIVNQEEELVAALKQKKVNKVYLQVNRDIPMNTYQSFIQEASLNNIEVFALDGSPKWIEDTNNRRHLFKKWVRKYQEKSIKSQEFAGIHLDVEPYLNETWKINQNLAIEKYQDIIIDFQNLSKTLEISFEADIPFWFDGRTYSSKKYGNGRLSDWVIRNTDSVTIMAYRNFAEGNNGIIKLVSDELEYAKKQNKRIVIGVETQKLSLSYLSFYGLGSDFLNDVLGKVSDFYSSYESFSGFAIHKYTSWTKLD